MIGVNLVTPNPNEALQHAEQRLCAEKMDARQFILINLSSCVFICSRRGGTFEEGSSGWESSYSVEA